MKRNPMIAKLREVDPQSFAEDMEWFLSGLDAPASLSDLDPSLNPKTSHFFDDRKKTPYTDHPKAKEETHELDESVINNKCMEQLNSTVKLVSEAHERWQDEMMETFLDHEEEIWEFATDINYCDSTLRLVEEALLKHYKKLEVASTSITNLYSESEDLSMSLENRKEFLNSLKAFLDDVTISPEAIKAICRDPIRFNYVQLLELFKMKSEAINTKYANMDYPALNPCKIQMKKLELVILRRIYDFMTTEIAKLAAPKANLQMIQNTYFLRLQPLYSFMMDTNAAYAADIRNQYSKTMRKVYHHLFSNYYQSLEKYRVKNRYREPSVIMKYSSSTPKGFFHLNDRESLVLGFKEDPLVPTGLQSDSITVDAILKCFLKLLVDTASSEYLFISKFFERDTESIFKYITEETVAYLRVRIDSLMKSSYDVVMFGIIFLLFGANRQVLKDREVTLFEETFSKMQSDIYHCIVSHTKALLEYINNQTKHATSSVIESWLPGSYAVNMSNIVRSLKTIKGLQSNLGLQPFGFEIIDEVLTSMNTIINQQAKKLNNPLKADILIIANCSAFIFPLEGLDLNLDPMKQFLNQHISSYANSYLHSHFEEMADLVTGIKGSSRMSPGTPQNTSSDTPEELLAKIEVSSDTVAMWRRISEEFNSKLQDKFKAIKSKVKLHFSQPATLSFVLHKIVEALEETYTQFHGHLCKMVKHDDKVWMDRLPVPGSLRNKLLSE